MLNKKLLLDKEMADYSGLGSRSAAIRVGIRMVKQDDDVQEMSCSLMMPNAINSKAPKLFY